MLSFRLTCLGNPRLFGEDGSPIQLRTRKHLALLIYLAIEPNIAHSRARLAAMLWPNGSDKQSRHSLATAVSVLRGRINRNALESTRDTLRLTKGLIVTDVQALLAGAPDPDVGPEIIRFLEGFEIPDAIEYQHWVDRTRARLMPVVEAHLIRRLEQSRVSGDSMVASTIADQLRSLDPLSEEAARASLEIRAIAGDRIGSLRAYNAWRNRLAEELGASPSLEMERMANRLKRGDLVRVIPHDSSAPIPVDAKVNDFVGRHKEFQACCQAWPIARDGTLTEVMVEGASGIGKSTLLARVANYVGLEGASVARLSCSVNGMLLPLAVLRDTISALLTLPGASSVDSAYLALLGTVAPCVLTRWPDLPLSSVNTHETTSLRLSEALRNLLRAVSEERPLAILIDDLHLADKLSVAILHDALSALEGASLLLITAQRSDCPGFLPLSPSPKEVLRLKLLGLAESDALKLLSILSCDKPELSPSVRRQLVTSANGNPRALGLLFTDWKERGLASLAFSVLNMGPDVSSTPPDAVIRRQNHMGTLLSDKEKLILGLTASLSTGLSDLSMYEALGIAPGEAAQALTRFGTLGLLMERDGTLQFSDGVAHGVAYLILPTPIRQAFHSRISDQLIAKNRVCTFADELDLAWHLGRSNRMAEALPHLINGAQKLIEKGFPHPAEIALASALARMEGGSREPVVLLLCEALQEQGRWRESLELVDSESITGPSAKASATAFRLIAKRWLGELADPELVIGIDELISTAASAHPIPTRVRAAAAAVRLLTLARDPDRIHRLEISLEDIPLSQCDRHDAVHLLLARAWTTNSWRRIADSLALLQEAIRIAAGEGLRGSIYVRLLNGLGNSLLVMGRYTEAKEPLVLAEIAAQRLDNAALLSECFTLLATAFGRLGEREAQIECARKAHAHSQPHDFSPGTLGATYELGIGLALEGRLHEARSVAVGLITSLPAERPSWLRQASLLCAADVMVLAGHSARASRLARAGIEVGCCCVLNESYAGLFARWIARTSMEDAKAERGLQILSRQFPTPQSLHPKDSVELRASQASLHRCLGTLGIEEVNSIREELSALPAGISTILKEVGLHPDYVGYP